MTYDQLAVSYLLQGLPIPPELTAEASIAAGEQCPDCGKRETESNGQTEYRCIHCDWRWGTDCGERYGY